MQVSSPAAELVLNNDIMVSHRAGAVAASGSGDMVEEVETSEAEVHGLVEDTSMDVDEGEEDEEEKEEEPEAVEDDDKLWPVASHPSVSALVPTLPGRELMRTATTRFQAVFVLERYSQLPRHYRN